MSQLEAVNRQHEAGRRIVAEKAAKREEKEADAAGKAKRAADFDEEERARKSLTGAAGVTRSENEVDRLGGFGAKRRSASRTLLG